MTKAPGDPVLVSAKFAEVYPGELVSKGLHVLRGVAGEHELFGLPAAPDPAPGSAG